MVTEQDKALDSLPIAIQYEYLKDPAGWFVKTERPSLNASRVSSNRKDGDK